MREPLRSANRSSPNSFSARSAQPARTITKRDRAGRACRTSPRRRPAPPGAAGRAPSRRHRASTPTAAPTSTASMSRNTTTSRSFRMSPSRTPRVRAIRARTAAHRPHPGSVMTDMSNPNPATSTYARDDVEDRHDDDRQQHRSRDRPLRLGGLLSEVRRRLEPDEDQHPVEDAEEDPAEPVRRDGFGSNAFAKSLSPPSVDDHLMKNASTTATETNASVSCTRVEICTPK